MTELQQGANAPLPSKNVRLVLTWQPADRANYDLDASAFLLADNGQVRGDQDMVFYNQPRTPDGAVSFQSGQAGRAEFVIDTGKLPSVITRIAITLTIDNAVAKGQSFGDLQSVRLAVVDANTGTEAMNYTVACAGRSEAALIVGEVYRRNDQVKFRAVGQGYNGGLAPLARSFGVEVEDEPTEPEASSGSASSGSASSGAGSSGSASSASSGSAPSGSSASSTSSSQGSSKAASASSAAASSTSTSPAWASQGSNVNLSKITLDKKGQSVSLTKGVGGDVSINLNWAREGTQQAPTGMFGGLFGGGRKGVDLDLGCLWELQNAQKGIVQALGNRFGSLREPPYIALSGDDRSGTVAEGETITVSSDHWTKIQRIAVYAYIYEGVPNWSAIDGVVTVRIPEQPPIEIKMDEPSGLGTCGIVLIENDGGAFKVTRMVEYFKSQRELDQRLGWGLRWVAGTKDSKY